MTAEERAAEIFHHYGDDEIPCEHVPRVIGDIAKSISEGQSEAVEASRGTTREAALAEAIDIYTKIIKKFRLAGRTGHPEYKEAVNFNAIGAIAAAILRGGAKR